MTTNFHRLRMFRGLSLWLILLVAACGTAPNSPADAPNDATASISPARESTRPNSQASSNEPLLVAAAANVQVAFVEIGQKFTEKNGQPVDFSFGSSGNLTTQIENGAPFDVFVAANVAFVNRLNDQALIFSDTQQLYAQGRIVLAVNRDTGLQVTSLHDLLDSTITWVVIANPELAPYGQAAKEVLQNAGLWEALQPKIVLAENIGQALQFVQTGDAPVGLIALAIAEVPDVSYTVLPADLHNPLNQSMAVVRSTRNEAAAREFIDFVTGPEGQAVLEKYGFQSPEGT